MTAALVSKAPTSVYTRDDSSATATTVFAAAANTKGAWVRSFSILPIATGPSSSGSLRIITDNVDIAPRAYGGFHYFGLLDVFIPAGKGLELNNPTASNIRAMVTYELL